MPETNAAEGFYPAPPIPPCVPCMRYSREERQPEVNVNAAASYLALHAAEVAKDETGMESLGLSAEEEGLVRGAQDKDTRVYFGAAILCGRTIGKGNCSKWRYDAEAHQIVSREGAVAE